MQAGIGKDDARVNQVFQVAVSYLLSPDIQEEQGTGCVVTVIYLRDGQNKSCSVPDWAFRPLPGVESVERITPPRITIAHNGNGRNHEIDLGEGIRIGGESPCRLVFGPCTVDREVYYIAELMKRNGLSMIRGGAFKPRSSPHSYPGPGEIGLHWLLEAAKNADLPVVFTELIETPHIDLLRRVRDQVGYSGKIVVWVGARTGNTLFLSELGRQTEFPVMLKHGLDAPGVDDLFERAEWVLGGGNVWREDGTLDKNATLRAVRNEQIILCLRGTRQTDKRSPWRFVPNHHWCGVLKGLCGAPVCIDPSHSAGTMVGDLVMNNVKEALRHRPHLLMVEGGYTGSFKGHCDVPQMIPGDRLPELVRYVHLHNLASVA
jgi:3-deoxy-7-phosphoheptulonate synthase